jgi:MFS family permease
MEESGGGPTGQSSAQAGSRTLIGNLSASVRARVASLPDRTLTAWKWDLLTGLFAGLYQGCIWTFVARVARAELQATDRQMGWIIAAPAFGYVFATVWARQMDGKAKLPFVYWTWLFSRGIFLLTPFLHSREQFVALVSITPFVFSISTPAYAAVMKDIYPDAQRGRLMSAVRMLMSSMTLLSALVMGRLLDNHLDWHLGFMVGGLFGALSAFTFSRIPMQPAVDSDEPRLSARGFAQDTLGILVRNPGYRWFTASVFVSGFGNLIATTLYPIYQVDRFQVTNTDVANLQNISSVATIVGFFFWGGFLDRRGPLTTVLLAVGFNCIAPLAYAAASGMGALYGAAAAMGLAIAGVDLAYLNTTLLFAEPGKAAQYQSLHSSFFGIRGSIAPLCAIPLMHAVSPRPAFLIAFCILLMGVGLQLVSMRDYRKEAARSRRTGEN